MGGQPGAHLIRSEQVGHHLEGRFLRVRGTGSAQGGQVLVGAGRADQAVRQGLVEALAEHPELERVEELVDFLPVPGHRQQVTGHGTDRLGGHVGEQRGELAVAQHAAEVLAQRVAGLALDLVHLVAVFSPTPGMPGRLSLGSPRTAAKSGYCAGESPYFSVTAAGVNRVMSVMPRRVISTVTRSETSWSTSRSPLTMSTSMPCASACVARVAMTSSAS